MLLDTARTDPGIVARLVTQAKDARGKDIYTRINDSTLSRTCEVAGSQHPPGEAPCGIAVPSRRCAAWHVTARRCAAGRVRPTPTAHRLPCRLLRQRAGSLRPPVQIHTYLYSIYINVSFVS